MTHINRTASSEAAPSSYASDPNIRILHRVATLEDFPLMEQAHPSVRRVIIVDTETTGTDPLVDEIIDIAFVTIDVDARGEIIDIVSRGQGLRDPGVPIPAQISRLTGLTDADVEGKVIDLDRLEQALVRADVRIAHNASFDIAFLENLMPGLAGAAWACSASDFDWLAEGFDGRKLGHLLMQIGWFNGAHRAMADVISLLHLLAHRLDDGNTVIGKLLDRAERPSIRFEANGAPFSRRSLLKGRGYHWDPRQRVWWIEIAQDECAEEERWFRTEIAPHGPAPRMLPITWNQRHR